MLQRTLNNPDPIGYDHFGSSVAISGNLAVVGAYSDSPNGVRAAGTAYVFNARTGALQATLNNPSPKLADFFGSSVAISENLAVVGAYNADPGGVIGAGIVHVFNATTGLLLATLNNPAPVMNGTFGWSVAISGNLAVVGAAYHGRSGAIGSGTAYVFNATTGLLLATLDPAVAGSDKFGFSVAISGNLAVVGSWGDDPAGVVDAGGAYIFDATTGLLLATLNDPEPVRNGTFGWSVAISGNLAVVGAISDDSGGVLDAGRAYVFEVTTGTLEVTLNNPSPTRDDLFGCSVAISGNLVVVGAYFDDPGEVLNAGAAYVFDATTGALQAILNKGVLAIGDWFGRSVAVSEKLAIVGADFFDPGEVINSGTASVFDCPPAPCNYSLNPPEAFFPASGGAGSVTVSASDGCGWNVAASDPSWIIILNPVGNGSGLVNYVVSQNSSSAAREGTITITGQIHTIHQCGALPFNAKLKTKIRSIGIPRTMTPDQSVHVSFIVTNTGNVTWTRECGFRLGKVNGTADPFGPDRIDLPPGATVAPGQSWTFETDFTAPPTLGIYTTKWQMLQEGNLWFGKSLQRKIKVVSPEQSLRELLFPSPRKNAGDGGN
ncbi:hypothetical protein HY256_11485 [Candidatus Sumerlaeota bacterium]|nr:hypothetical protein [Candidatus Sumerlaeota bacterium]